MLCGMMRLERWMEEKESKRDSLAPLVLPGVDALESVRDGGGMELC